MLKAKIKNVFFIFGLFLFFGFLPKTYAASLGSSLPLNTEVVAKLQSEWQFSYEKPEYHPLPQNGGLAPSPGIFFEADGNKVYFTLMPKSNIAPGKEPSSAYGLVKINSKYLNCDGGPLKLWFDNGKFVQTGPTICQHVKNGKISKEVWVIAEAPAEGMAEQKRLARLLQRHHFIALSQPKKIIMFFYRDLTPLKKFAKAIG